MSEQEFDEMRALIKRYAETEMDQWAAWRTETKYGMVYVLDHARARLRRDGRRVRPVLAPVRVYR
jgi:hypothetical protein